MIKQLLLSKKEDSKEQEFLRGLHSIIRILKDDFQYGDLEAIIYGKNLIQRANGNQ